MNLKAIVIVLLCIMATPILILGALVGIVGVLIAIFGFFIMWVTTKPIFMLDSHFNKELTKSKPLMDLFDLI